MFREYLRKAPDAPNKIKEETNAHIAQCQALLAEQNASAGPVRKSAAAPPAAAVPLPQPPIVALSPSVALATPAAPPSPGTDGRGLRIAGALTAAVGVCAVGLGIGLNIKERSLTNEINAKFSQSKESSRASYEAWGYASYGLGATALLTGATLYYFGWRASENRAEKQQLALVPALAPDTVTFVLHGRL